MKKLKIISTALAALLCLFSLTSCFTLFAYGARDRGSTSAPPKLTPLSAPENLALDKETKTLTWDAVPDAFAYNVSIGDMIIRVSETSYILKYLSVGQDYFIKVNAIGDGINFADSPYSPSILYELYSEYENGENLSFFSIEGGEAYSVAKGSSKSLNILIPSTYNNKPVTLIAEKGFYGDSITRNIVIPEGVTSVGQWAFLRCSRLTSVYVPNSVVDIGYRVFEDCSALTSVTLNRPASEGITMAYGGNAFYNCKKLENIYVPADSVEAYKASPAWSEYASLIKAILA
jgi:hypothetical protein